jgi:hypothetical protein
MTATATSAFAQVLSTAPGSCTAIRSEIEQIYRLKICGGTYTAIWKSLVKFFGADGAATVVEDVVDICIARKALIRLMGKREKTLVDAMLSDRVSKAAKRGRINLRKTSQLVEDEAIHSQPRRGRRRVVSHDHIQLPVVRYDTGRCTSAYQPIERVTHTGCTNLKARSNWLEHNLENYIERHWNELSFGLERPLKLEGRQVRLSKTREKVDLLANMGTVVIPIELKIKRASGSDLTQLQSYRQDLINRGFPRDSVLGILVAPEFSSKILNVMPGTTGVILRWFEMPVRK